MPTIPTRTRATTRSAVPKVEPKQAVPPTQAHPRPTHHNGVAVVSEERLGNLPNGIKFKVSRLYLANGEVAHACWECTFTGDTRGDVMSHRNTEHGTQIGRRRVQRIFEDPHLLDLVLPAREDGTQPGDNPLYWQIGEIIAVVPTIKALGDHMERLEDENAQLREEVGRTRVTRTDQHKLDVYESNQQEIGELRARLKHMPNIEALRAEVYELRAWKKKMIKRLGTLGFQLSEEDQ